MLQSDWEALPVWKLVVLVAIVAVIVYVLYKAVTVLWVAAVAVFGAFVALLSAFASVGRVWVGPLAGVLAQSIGWPEFFVVSTLLALPALVLLVRLRAEVRRLEFDPRAPLSDD